MAEENENREDDGTLYVGVTGYQSQKFDEADAKEYLEEALDDIENHYIESGEFKSIAVVSGLTNVGMPKVAYEVADSRGYETIGVAPEEVNEHELYPVDEIIYEGKNFGDESETFVDMLDVFVRIGGGAQSQHELELAEAEEISVMEYDLESYSEE